MINCIFLLLLAVYPLRHIWLGVELTDSAYSAGNYRFSEGMNGMWLFSTYLANAAGGFLSRLPGGNRLMGLNFYTALFISMTAIAVYLFFAKVLKTEGWLAFLGVLLAVSLCWCPTTILYNYMTYFFFNLAIILLYMGLVKEKRILLFAAGILLGMNVLVRFPNLTEAALILSVWYYGVLQWKRWKDVLQETGICLFGYLAGAGIVLLSIIAKYGLQEYIDGIVKLMNMPSDASDYSLYSMVLTVLMDYKASSRWLLCMFLLTGMGCLVSGLVFKAVGNREIKKGWRLAGKLCFLGGILVMFRWWYSIGVFNIKYYTYESMFQWTAVFLIITIIAGGFILFSKKSTRNEKLLASMVLILIAVTPLGSNNHLYPNMNNMFLVFPFTLSVFQRFLGSLGRAGYVEFSGRKGIGQDRRKNSQDRMEMEQDKKKWKISLCPVSVMLSVFLLVTAVQCFLFGAVFTFRDGMSGQKRDTKIEKNVILKGMVTNRELAEAIEELTVYMDMEELTDRKLILYGQIPAVSYMLDMRPAISTSWPDLRSYSYEVMVADMENLREGRMPGGRPENEISDEPVIILGAGLDGFLRKDEEAMDAAELTEKERKDYETDKKLKLILDFMEAEGYERSFGNARFAVYKVNED